MAGTLNKVMLIGYAGRDPEVRNGDRPSATLSLATSERWTDRSSGEKRERTEWHRVVVFNEHLAGVVEKYVRKGSKLYIEGQLQTRKWADRDGKDRWTTEIVVSGYNARLSLIDKVESDAERGHEPAAAATAPKHDDDIPY